MLSFRFSRQLADSGKWLVSFGSFPQKSGMLYMIWLAETGTDGLESTKNVDYPPSMSNTDSFLDPAIQLNSALKFFRFLAFIALRCIAYTV